MECGMGYACGMLCGMWYGLCMWYAMWHVVWVMHVVCYVACGMVFACGILPIRWVILVRDVIRDVRYHLSHVIRDVTVTCHHL
jgi:hypothetical protein